MSIPVLKWGMTFSSFLVEAGSLPRDHWNEVGTFREALHFNPDHDRYRAAERAGALRILTAHVDGCLAGYLFLLIIPHPRDKNAILARDDIFYVRPSCRRMLLGPTMIDEVMTYAEQHAHIIMLSEKVRRSATRGVRGGDYLMRWGLEPLEVVWGRVLRNPHGDAT